MRVNIIMRTLNEGKWLPLCLERLEKQTFQDFHVSIIDSGSTDNTLSIAAAYPRLAKSISIIEQYTPGRAINIGAEQVSSDYIIVLSAHCVPISDDWLSNFISYMESNPKLQAAYGRQLPCEFTGPDDARDLTYLFRGKTHVTQSEFFHNANSILCREAWKSLPFNEDVLHIEDLLWAQEAKRRGFSIGYVKEASVSHYHGINQHENYHSFRSDKLLNILTRLDIYEQVRLPQIFDNIPDKIATVFIGRNTADDASFSLLNEAMFKNRIFAESITGYSKNISLSELLLIIAKYANERKYLVVQIIDREHVYFDVELVNAAKVAFTKYFPDAVLTCWQDTGNYIVDYESRLDVVQNNNYYSHMKSKINRIVLGQGSILCVASLIQHNGEIPSGVLKSTSNSKILLKNNVQE